MLHAIAASIPKVAKTQPIKEQVLESFMGKVESVDGEIAHIMLVDRRGQESFADYYVSELESNGILALERSHTGAGKSVSPSG